MNSSHSDISNTSDVDKVITDNSDLLNRYYTNTNLDDPARTIVIVMYAILFIIGAFGNILVIVSVLRKPAMRTPRNMFILNLAVADLLLCTVTIPFTLMEILTKFFPLGNNPFICKLIGTSQAICIYVSTITITAIALDRYQVIVYPTKESLQLFGAGCILFLIWFIAIVLALPLFIYKDLIVNNVENLNINYCIEDWPFEKGRAYYSVFALIFQYALPIITVSAAYLRISHKLRRRFAAGFVSSDESSQRNRRQLRGRRLQRTNLLLGSIAVIFLISWLPLNIFNLIADLSPSGQYTTQPMMICFAVCHMIGMSSACSNPILYGCLNDNFWKEFNDILCARSSNTESGNESYRLSLRKQSQKILGSQKPDLVNTDYQQCNTVSTDMTVLTKG